MNQQVMAKLALDVAAPLGLYYGLRAAGAGVWWALLAAAVPPLYLGVREFVTRRRVDRVALVVLALLVTGMTLALLAGSPELMMARGSAGTAVFGIAILASRLGGGRPLMLELFGYVLPPVHAGQWEQQWRDDPEFRRGIGLLNTSWGVAFLLDAAGRVVMAYTLPLDLVPLLGVALLVAMLVPVNEATKRYAKRRTGGRKRYENRATGVLPAG